MKWWVKALLESVGFIVIITIIDHIRKRNTTDRVEEAEEKPAENTTVTSFQQYSNFVESVYTPHENIPDESTLIKEYTDNKAHNVESAIHLYCRKCGKEISLDSDFCCYCGTKVIHRKD